jgi:serine/threonine-protein kinase
VEIDVGHAIAGKYELVRLLGRGSMGEVWVAHHRSLNEKVAVKLLTRPSEEGAAGDGGDRSGGPDESLEDRATAAARFKFEAQVAARLSRKTRHIVSVTDHGEEEGLPYLVMELLEGETLEARLQREDRLPAQHVLAIASQIGRALSAAHAEGVFHRDLKPANVFLMRDEDGNLLVKLLDFGIARATHAHRASRSTHTTARGVVFGTPNYMSPEQARGSSRLDQRCDLWALATILYECASGELPVEGTDTDRVLHNLCAGRIIPIRTRASDLPETLDAFFARAFAEDVDKRFPTAAELVQAFADAIGTSVVVEAGADRADDESAVVDSAHGSVLDRQARARAAGERTGPSKARRVGRAVLTAVFGASVLLVAAVIAGRTLLARPATAPRVPASAAPLPSVARTDGSSESAAAATGSSPASAAASHSSKDAATAVPSTASPHGRTRPAPAQGGAGAHGGQAAPPAAATPPAATRKIDKSEVF